MALYTPEEIADIFFQSKNRITKKGNPHSGDDSIIKSVINTVFSYCGFGESRFENKPLKQALEEIHSLNLPQTNVAIFQEHLQQDLQESYSLSRAVQLISSGASGPRNASMVHSEMIIPEKITKIHWNEKYPLGIPNNDPGELVEKTIRRAYSSFLGTLKKLNRDNSYLFEAPGLRIDEPAKNDIEPKNRAHKHG